MSIFNIFKRQRPADSKSSAQSNPAVPSKHAKKNPTTPVVTISTEIISSQADDVIPATERVKSAIPSKHGLYPHEILMLDYADSYYTVENSFQGFWWYRYGVRNVADGLRSLVERGFLQIGDLQSAIEKENATVLKEELKKRGLKTSGKKADLVKRLLEEAPHEELNIRFSKRTYQLTDLGKQALAEESYVSYIHRHQLEDLDIWSLNKIVYTPHINVPIDYESLSALGTIMGSGGLVIMDEDTCMVDLAKYFLDFIKDESCGKCTACRSGTLRMLEVLERITKGEGREGDIELLEELGQGIKDSALCGLGQSAPNPVLSTIRYFRHEYEEHIKDKYCRASVCATMFHSSCHNSCPAGIDIPIYVDLIRQKRYLDAYHFIKRDNPLPLICGRVCNHPCEGKCNRSKIDDAIAIRDLKRFASDYAFDYGPLEETVPVRKKNIKVAIVGSGPAGLTCAYYLAKKGYQVTVFEEKAILGGMLATVIPEYRLPKAKLNAEIDTIKALGVEFKTNCCVGVEKQVSLEDLKDQGYQATFIAVGTHLELRLNQPGEELDGVISGITFLQNINLGPVPDLTGKTVAVIGGGNVAIDAARCALRVGAKEVNIVYRRAKGDMPALSEEIREAEIEGINIHTMVNSKRIFGENGKVKALECIRMRGGNFDISGRRRSVSIEGTEFYIPVDIVIVAVGQTLKRDFLQGTGVEIIEPGMIGVTPKTYLTSVEGIFAAGDCISGPSTVVDAVKGGKEAASNIDKYLGGDGNIIPNIQAERKLSGEILEKEQPRQHMKSLPVAQRLCGFAEVELGFTEDEAVKEACRCLRCDVKK